MYRGEMMSLLLLLVVVCLGSARSAPDVQTPPEGPFSYEDLVWELASKQARKTCGEGLSLKLDIFEARIVGTALRTFVRARINVDAASSLNKQLKKTMQVKLREYEKTLFPKA